MLLTIKHNCQQTSKQASKQASKQSTSRNNNNNNNKNNNKQQKQQQQQQKQQTKTAPNATAVNDFLYILYTCNESEPRCKSLQEQSH